MSQAKCQADATGVESDLNPVVRSVPARAVAAIVGLQFAAAGLYVGFFVSRDAPDPFSVEDWVFMLFPPLVFGVLFFTGMFIAGLARRSLWQVVLMGVGCMVSLCGLVATVLLVPLWFFASFIDYVIG